MTRNEILVVGLALILSGCNPPSGMSENGARSQAVFTTAVAKRQDLTGYSFFDGKLVVPESAQATASSPYDTPVASVTTGLGKHVLRGEPIIKLTIPGADEASAAAKSDVNSAKSDYKAQKADTSQPIQQAQQALDDARATEKAARDTIAAGGQADLDGATQARETAEAALSQAQQTQKGSLQPTKEALAAAATTLSQVRADAAKGIVRAPISGTVVAMAARPGQTATAGQSLATIVNFGASRVQGLVPPELKALVFKGSRVIIAMEGASSEPLEGVVVDVDVAPPAEGQKSPGYLAVIQFLNPREIVTPAFSVKRVGVKTGTAKDVLVVPVGAISTKNGKSMVTVKNGDGWTETEVETGISDGALVEIKSGLQEGAVARVLTVASSG